MSAQRLRESIKSLIGCSVIRRSGDRVVKLSENPVLRVLAVIVLIAAGIRLTFELLEPIWPQLLGVLIALALLRTAWWWHRRW